MPSGFRSGPGSTSSGFRAGGAGYGGFRGERIPTTKRKKSFWDEAFEVVAAASGLGPLLLSEHGPDRYSRGVGRTLSVLGSAPAGTLFYPKASVAGGWKTIQGLWEAPYALYKGTREEGFGDTMDILWQGIKEDYKRRYGENWREAMRDDPLSNLFDALTVYGSVIRGVSLAGAAGRLGRAGKTYGAADIWRESARPGLLSEGEPWMRQLEYQPPVGLKQVAEQPYSRSPTRRGTQYLADYLASALPNAPILGAAARTNRTMSRNIARHVDRIMALPRHVGAIDRLPEAGKVRLYFGAQLGDHSTRALKQLRRVLEREYATDTKALDGDPEFADWLHQSKQAGFGQELLKRIDEAIEYEPDARYERALEAMRDMTDVSENVIADANGFTSLAVDIKRMQDRLEGLDPGSDAAKASQAKLDELEDALAGKDASLREMFQGRRRRLLDYVRAKDYADVPEREAWLTKLTQMFGEEQAQMMIEFADGIAGMKRSPARFWRDNIGLPPDEGAEAFMGRVGGQALYQRFGRRMLIEGPAVAPAETTAFYSPLQKWIAESWPGHPVPATELRGKLQREIPPEEYDLTNLDQFFEERGPTDLVTQDELQAHFASPLNAYNLREHHYSNTTEAMDAGFLSEYDEPSLVSREPGTGEYHELVFDLPGETQFKGAGAGHWNKPNVVFHIRFQAFREGDKAKLVIEEVQSDWAAAHRKGEAGKGLPVPPSPLGSNRYLRTMARRMARYAADNGIDEIIIADPSVMHLRTARDPLKALDRRTLERMSPEQVRDFLDQNPNPMWDRLYRDKMKEILDSELGVEGRVVDNAYEGRYAGGMYGSSESIEGPMRGLVYKATPELLEKGRKAQALMQRQPDWNALPRGATELLAGGGTRAHIFEGANASTWIHELGHIAAHDLDEADQAILGGHYAAGKALGDWKDAEHESFARDFERYVREGVAPNPALRRVFEKLSLWMQAVLGKSDAGADVPPEVRRVFEGMFRSESEPDIFIPHRAGAPNLAGGRTSRGIPRASREIGDRTFPREPLFARNELALLRSGLINPDPNLLIEHTNRVVMLARANQLREAVLEMAEPLIPGGPHWPPDLEQVYVVKRAGVGVDKPLYDALEAADNPSEIRTAMRDFIDEHITDEKTKYEAWGKEKGGQLYVVDKRLVDSLFKHVTGKTPGATTKTGGSTSLAVVDAVLDSIRGLLLYANPGFYASNMLGNAWMMTTSDPRAWKNLMWSMENAAKAGKPGEDLADPLWERISVEMGRGPTSGAFSYRPQFIGEGPGRSSRMTKRAAEGWSRGLGTWGRKAGRIIDDSFRVAAWRQVATKHGYKTEAQVRKLLDDAAEQRKGLAKLDSKEKRDLASIRDEAENLMLDFDSMTPFERTYLQRFIFLYPFIRASTKYPIMFAGERPVTAGAMGQAGIQGNITAANILGERPDLPAWAQGYARGPGGWWNVGSFAPWAAGLDLAETLMGVGQPTEIGVNRPFSMVNPGLQMLVDLARSQNRYGRDAPWYEILQSDFPAPGYLAQLYGRKPSERYTDRGGLATLMRALRVLPFEMEEGVE